jgi:CheY-like chemotaxis protein
MYNSPPLASIEFGVGRIALVVDDDTSYRQTISELLAEGGWEVVEASTGEDALALPDTNTKPDVLVADINLGDGMDGWTLGRLARDQWPDIGLLFVSGTNQPPQRYDHICSGRFLLKSFFHSDFLIAVAEATRTAAAGPH